MEVTSDIPLFYEQHCESMLRMALRLLGDEEEAQDVVSDVFARLMDKPDNALDTTEGDAGMSSYLLSAVRNRCLNVLRHKRLSERVHRLLPIGEDVSEEPQVDESADPLDAMLQFIDTELTPQTRDVVRLRFQQQMTYREISTHLGISEVAVYKHLAKAIRKLKERFNP